MGLHGGQLFVGGVHRRLPLANGHREIVGREAEAIRLQAHGLAAQAEWTVEGHDRTAQVRGTRDG